jgi:signal transduction histidine kinase
MYEAEHGLRSAEAVLHEARSTMAGLSSAAHLLAVRRGELSEPDRARLESMSSAEMGRMQRLLDQDHRAGLPVMLPVALSEVIGPLVESLRARGHDVSLVDTGVTPCQALARADDVAEVVHILLDNAARHGSGSPIVVDIVSLDTLVGITVNDHGPGVPTALLGSLFDWGTSRPGSVGRGIGLNVALARAREMGGDLQLASSRPGRTSFELTLPGVVVGCA